VTQSLDSRAQVQTTARRPSSALAKWLGDAWQGVEANHETSKPRGTSPSPTTARPDVGPWDSQRVRRRIEPVPHDKFVPEQPRPLHGDQAAFGGVSASCSSVGGSSRFSQGLHRNASLFGSVESDFGQLSVQQIDLPLGGGGGRAPIREIRTDSSSSSNRGKQQRAYRDAVLETRLRFAIGIALFLVGIWLIYYCDRTFNRDLGWRGWFLLFGACVGLAGSFVLLLYPGSLTSLRAITALSMTALRHSSASSRALPISALRCDRIRSSSLQPARTSKPGASVR